MIDTQLTGSLADLIYLAGFVAFFSVPFFVYVGLVLVGAVTLPPTKKKGAGRRLFGPLFIGYYYWLLGPTLRLVARTSLTPNMVTGASLLAALASAVAIATGHFALASALVIGGSSFDIIDGYLARVKKMASPAGAFFDSTVDRINDGLMFSGCAVYYSGTPMMYVCLAALVMTYTVSYTRSRGEALGLTGAEGLMQRADRIVVLGIALAFSPYFGHRAEGFVAHPFYAVTAGALCLLALLNTVTAVSRISWSLRQLKRAEIKAYAPRSTRDDIPEASLTPVPSTSSAPLGSQVPPTVV
ncbi:MAG: CDP-alcohol phosphatidyltransferase family protein [Polyangia bacterium]